MNNTIIDNDMNLSFKRWLSLREAEGEVPGSSIFPGWEASRQAYYASPEGQAEQEKQRKATLYAWTGIGGGGEMDPEAEKEACHNDCARKCAEIHQRNLAAAERRKAGYDDSLFGGGRRIGEQPQPPHSREKADWLR